ncbi:PREDICTED: uncharacterized protein LOC105457866, partial [Wasmannia auropunctata]|uniref:uncharacterized protein LOC105457866 n=1 Tax=Wasmannia auropunctata TaxID=64793 RepID=UPI0005EFF972
RFFGTVRQAAGSNDHPGVLTFLQIYKILSTFSVIKPPQYGNCMVVNDEGPMVVLSDIKELYKDSRHNQTSLTKLKEKLNNINNHNDEYLDVFLEHDYSQLEVIDCVIYQVTGYLSKHILKFVKCDICKNAFTTGTTYSPFPPALL